MRTFLFETSVQAVVIAVLWVLVARDATRLRDRNGVSPAGISPFAWGALCGLIWVPLVPYLVLRRRAPRATRVPERNLLRWWILLAVAVAVQSGFNASHDDANNATQHAILSGIFVVCALVARSRDRATARGAVTRYEAGLPDP